MNTPLRIPAVGSDNEAETRRAGALVEPAGEKTPHWFVPGAVGLCVLGVLLIVSLLWSRQQVAEGHSQIKSLREENGSLTQQLQALRSHEPTCSDAEADIAQVRDFLARGQRGTAIALAEAALNQEGRTLCTGVKAALGDLWYGASMDDLFAISSTDDFASRNAPLKWLAIERKADAYEVAKAERVAPMTVAQRAYSAALWPLTDVAFRKAWEAGHIGVESAAFRYAALWNWGNHLAFVGKASSREEGIRLLATAQAIAKKYGLNARGEACADLERLGYADCNEPAPDSSDPLLTTAGN